MIHYKLNDCDMKNFNLDLIKEETNVQYNDMKGYAAIDGHLSTHLWKLCSDNGINTDEWFLIGLGFSGGKISANSTVGVCAYLVKKDNPSENYDQITSRMSNMGVVDVHKKYFRIPLLSLGNYIKRINMTLFTSISANIQSMNIISDID